MSPLPATTPIDISATAAFSEPKVKLQWTRISQGPATPKVMWKTNQWRVAPMDRIQRTRLRNGYRNSATMITPPVTPSQ